MSNAKIRISWDNPNLRATFVKIFRKQTVFNEDTLPEVYATVPYGTNFYDDFNIEYNQDYYYMLACVHDEQKIFTECYYIKPVRDVSKTLTVQFVFFVPSVMNTEWNANTGEFRLHKGSISYQAAGTSLKVYANPFRKSSDGAFYFEHGVLSGIHEGSVDNILDSYDTMVKVAQENNYDIIGSPTEVLVKNIHNADSEEEYITEIRLPIIKM